MNMHEVKMKTNRFGLIRLAWRRLYRIINKFMCFRIFVLTRLIEDNLTSGYAECADGFSCRWLSPAELEIHRSDEELQIDRDLTVEAAAKGDEILGLFRDGVLVSYSCYSNGATRFFSDLDARPKGGYIYTYKNRTKVSSRGQRLHGRGLAMALKRFTAAGCSGLISFVQITNFGSLKSMTRLGFEVEGKVLIIGLFGLTATLRSPRFRNFVEVIDESGSAGRGAKKIQESLSP